MIEKQVELGQYMIARQLVNVKLKTEIWAIENKNSGSVLGIVKWHSPWRQYCLFSNLGIVFSIGCLQKIESFMKQLNEKHKQG